MYIHTNTHMCVYIYIYIHTHKCACKYTHIKWHAVRHMSYNTCHVSCAPTCTHTHTSWCVYVAHLIARTYLRTSRLAHSFVHAQADNGLTIHLAEHGVLGRRGAALDPSQASQLRSNGGVAEPRARVRARRSARSRSAKQGVMTRYAHRCPVGQVGSEGNP